MTNRRLITTVFIIGCVTIYSIIWYFLSQNMNGFLVKRMEIAQEKIKLFGYPFNIKFKIQDASIESVSYNLFSKKLYVNLKKAAFGSLGDEKVDDVLKDIEYIRFSSRLDSYFTLMQIIQNKGTKFEPIDAFNLFSNVAVSLKADLKDPSFDITMPIVGTWNLSLPGKRMYENYQDILSDLPQNLTFEGAYEEDMIIGGDILPFMHKIAKLSYPAKSQLKLTASLTDHADILEMNEVKFIELMRKLNIGSLLTSFSNSYSSETKMIMGAGTDVHNVNIDYTIGYKDRTLQNFYTIFDSQDIVEIIEIILYRYKVQLNDNSKLKFKLLGDFIVKKMKTEVEKDPNYWEKFDNYKSNTKIALLVPYKEGFGGMKYLMDLADNKNSSWIKLEGFMTGSGIPDSSNGALLINNKLHSMSEVMNILRLVFFAVSRTVTSEHFNGLLENFDKDIQIIDDILLSLSDEPNSTSDQMLYSYNINKQDIMNSKFSKSGKTVVDILVAFAPLFALPEERDNTQQK